MAAAQGLLFVVGLEDTEREDMVPVLKEGSGGRGGPKARALGMVSSTLEGQTGRRHCP